MFDGIAGRYDLVNRVLTFRLDVRWRKLTLQKLALKPGDVALDLACGTGDFATVLAEQGVNPIGIDLSYGMLTNYQTNLGRAQGDLLDLPIKTASVEGCVCGFALRNLTEIPPFIDELFRVTKPGGRIALLEVSEPKNALLRAGHKLYFQTIVPRIGALLSDKDAYSYLPASVEYLPSTHELLGMIQASGFVNAENQQLTGGISQLFSATKPEV